MKTKVFTLAALLCCASAMYAQESEIGRAHV